MPLIDVPDELLVKMCCFVCVKTLVRLRETCTRWRLIAEDKDAWTNALFTYSGEWYQLKDVVLAAKYMEWSGHFVSPSPTFDTMDNVAFWGSIVHGERLLATSNPRVCKFQFSIMSNWNTENLVWVSPETPIEQDWLLNAKEYEHKICHVRMYVLVNLENDIGMYHFTSGVFGEDDLLFGSDDEAELVDTSYGFEFQVWDNGNYFKHKEWLNWKDEYLAEFEDYHDNDWGSGYSWKKA
jgi:hypothetical protein